MIFPDAADVDGKRVIVKIDSGSGRTNPCLLAKLRLRGVVLYPGCPNNTSVSQETDRNYSPFKTGYRTILEQFAADREHRFLRTTANMSFVGLFIFGGTAPTFSQALRQLSFEKASSNAFL